MVMDLPYPFPPGGHKRELSAFPPVAGKGRFPPVIVVDIQVKTPTRGLLPAVRGPVVPVATCCLAQGSIATAGWPRRSHLLLAKHRELP